MAEIKERIKKAWKAITFPDGVDIDYDERCDKSFDKFFNSIINICYLFFFLFSIISIYFLITREVL